VSNENWEQKNRRQINRQSPPMGNRQTTNRQMSPMGNIPPQNRQMSPMSNRPPQNRQMSPMGNRPPQNRQMSPMGNRPPQNRQMSPMGNRSPQSRQMSPMGNIPPQNGQMSPMSDRPPQNGQMSPMGNRSPQSRQMSPMGRPPQNRQMSPMSNRPPQNRQRQTMDNRPQQSRQNTNNVGTRMQKRQKKEKHHSFIGIFVKTFLIVFLILFICLGAAFAAFKYYTKDMKRETIDETVLSVNEVKKEQSMEMKIKNIAVFGVDSRNGEDTGNSDAIMIVSIDGKRGKIKMVSIARDTYVNLPKYGKTKITHAYSYGGPELAMATLNENFGMDITDYITVNFEQLAQIIEQMGGIDVEINEGERQELNKYVAPGVEKIQETGAVHLNGEQAVSYSRIRKNDNDDMRTGRQRKVMMCLFEKAKEISPMQYPSYVKMLMPMMETSMTDSEILQLAPVAMNKDLLLEQDSFPNDYIQTDGYKTKTEVEGIELWVYHYDLEQATNMLQKFIYDDIPFEQQ
jgi:LCP family protein required for cell wall assembly